MNQEQLSSWLDAYGRAWETGDADALSTLFTADATYHEKPFDEPMCGQDAIRTYWSQIPSTQRDIAFAYDALAVDSDQGIAYWSASFIRIPAETRVWLDGIFVLRFDPGGRCQSLQEWWHIKELPIV